MENYLNTGGAKPSAWTARAGVVVDLDPPLSARSGSQRLSGTGQDGRPLDVQNSSVIHSGNYLDYEGMNSLPIMNAAVNSNMFMQTVNFDIAMKKQISQNNTMNTSDGQLDRSMETSMDLLEQQQAIEQARLLQRFKELRQMQLQQQELLMQQQKNQLDALKQEQKQVQNILAKQRQNKWGGKPNGAIRGPSNCSTPPLRKNPGVVPTTRPTVGSTGSSSHTSQSESNAQHDVTQSTGQLPRPVIYVPLDDETDEIKTNPDLFSDTNSYVGSLATTEEGIYPVPESASEASGDVYRPNKQKPLKCPKLKPSKHHRDFTKDHGSEFHDISRTIDLDEPDEGIGTQSLRSSGHVEHQDPADEDSDEDVEDVANIDDVDELSEDNDDDNDDNVDDDDSDDDELEEQILEDEDDESEDENQNNTCIETGVVKDDLTLRPEDRPITGIGGKKTFEELLEEQLRAEEEKLKAKAPEASPTSESPKRAFLKKGVGLSRFGMTGNQKPQGKTVINKANVKSTLPQGAIVTSKTEQKNKTKHSADKKTTKVSPKHSKSVKKSPVTSPRRDQVQTNLKLIAKTGTQKSINKEETTYHNSNSKKPKSPPGSPGKVQTNHKQNSKVVNSKSTGKEETTHKHSKEKKMSDRVPINKQSARLDAIPDDASFIDKIEQRERNKELEQEDLEEFEMLEDFADNASFCSNSSIVQKVMERDRIKSRLGLPQSPRTSVAQQIALASRKGELKKKIDQALQEEPSKICSTETSQKEKDKNHKDTDSSSEEETSESEEESSELSEDTDDDGDQESPIKRVTKESNNARTKNRYNDSDDSSSASSSEDDGDDDDDDEHIDSENVIKSPSKIMTRKIASKEDRSTLNTVTNLLQKLNSGSLRPGDSHDDSLNSSSFVPQAKSAIVISRDTVMSKGASSRSVIPETDEVEFQLHSQFSSHAKHSSPVKAEDDKSDSEMSETSSYKALNISAKIAKAGTGSAGATKQHSALSKTKEMEFDDEEEWGDTTLKEVKDKRTENNSNVDYTTDNIKSQDDNITDGTPPTSKLVTKLFPKLKPQPTKQQQQEQQQLQMVNTAPVGDGIQSKVLREKLTELEKEIEKFRNENATLERQRKEREEGLNKLRKEVAAFEKEKNEELNRIQEYKNEEMKKIKHEKKMFEKYQKASRNMPDKKEREEIAMLKTQLSELQEEMKRKESRWTSSNSRLRSKLEQLEQENSELKEEIKLMEKKRLEWLQKEQTANKNKAKPQQQQQQHQQSNYQQDMIVVNNMQKNSADFQTTDSDEEKDPVRDHSEVLPNPVQQTGPSNIKLNQSRPEVSVKGEIPFPPGNYGNHGIRPSMSASHHQGQSTTGQQKLSQNKPTHPNTAISRNNNAKVWTSSNPVGGASNNVPRNIGHMAQPLRMSLMEDTPRQEPTVAATKQDTSMYSDGEGFEMLNSNNSLPRKKASKFNVDKSAIDKGSSGYEEVQHTDGKVERVYSTGAREILFSNGTRKEISADGQSIVVSFFNGDIKQMMPDQTVKYYYAEAQTTHSTYPDGLEILQFPNNQVEKHYPDGTKEITFPDQTIKYLFPNGSEESIFPDGTVIRIDKAGDKTMEFPNGQREIHTQEYKRREYPDGTVKTVYPDGRQETRYSNGRIRVKDRDGNIIIDRRC